MAHKVIREILPYILARFALKLGHAKFRIPIICLNTTFSASTSLTETRLGYRWVHIYSPTAG